MKSLLTLVITTLIFFSCNSENKEAENNDSNQMNEEVLLDESSGRDLTNVNVCEILPAELIAESVGAVPDEEDPVVVTDPGFEGKGCRFTTALPVPDYIQKYRFASQVNLNFGRQ